MSSKNILIVTAQAIENSTSSMIRILSIANALAEQGYQIDLITAFSDPDSIYHSEINHINRKINIIRIGQKKTTKGGKVQGKISASSWVNVISRKLYRKFDLFGASIELLFRGQGVDELFYKIKYDYLISFSGPVVSHILSNKIIKKMEHKPYYIQQWGDPLTLNMADRTIVPSFIKRFIEYTLLKHSDKICYVSPITLMDQKLVFKDLSRKMSYTPTPSQFHEIKNMEIENGELRLGYFGSYNSVARNISPLYQVISSLNNTRLLLVGDSDIKLQSRSNMSIESRVSKHVTNKLMTGCDVLICLLNISGNQIPGKVFHYSGTSKEILIVLDGENREKIKRYFSKYNRYSFCENNTGSISEAIKRYLNNGVPERSPLEKFSPGIVAIELLKML
jgi:hypothetical protein